MYGRYLPSIIIGGNIISCGSTVTGASSVDRAMINNNPGTINEAISRLRRIDVLDNCATSTQAIRDLERFNSFLFRAGCSNRAVDQLTAGEQSTWTRLRAQYAAPLPNLAG